SAAAAIAGGALARWTRAMARYQARVTATLLLVTGGYVATYWWPAITGHSPTGHGLAAIDRWSATTTTRPQAQPRTLAAAALALIILTALATMTARLRRRSPTRAAATSDTTTAEPDDCSTDPARDDHTTAPNTRSRTAT